MAGTVLGGAPAWREWRQRLHGDGLLTVVVSSVQNLGMVRLKGMAEA